VMPRQSCCLLACCADEAGMFPVRIARAQRLERPVVLAEIDGRHRANVALVALTHMSFPRIPIAVVVLSSFRPYRQRRSCSCSGGGWPLLAALPDAMSMCYE
jgi:hypothetical protein